MEAIDEERLIAEVFAKSILYDTKSKLYKDHEKKEAVWRLISGNLNTTGWYEYI